MRKLYFLFITSFIFMAHSSAQLSMKVIINAYDDNLRISRNIYGHFSEHLGRCIYDGFVTGEASVKTKDRIRLDVVEALKKIRIPILRWPGGCFADQYHWQDGIGVRDQRPERINTTWGMVT